MYSYYNKIKWKINRINLFSKVYMKKVYDKKSFIMNLSSCFQHVTPEFKCPAHQGQGQSRDPTNRPRLSGQRDGSNPGLSWTQSQSVACRPHRPAVLFKACCQRQSTLQPPTWAGQYAA